MFSVFPSFQISVAEDYLNTLSLNDVKILTEPRATLTETSAPRRRLTVKNRTLTEPGQSIPSEILEEIFLRLSTQEWVF